MACLERRNTKPDRLHETVPSLRLGTDVVRVHPVHTFFVCTEEHVPRAHTKKGRTDAQKSVSTKFVCAFLCVRTKMHKSGAVHLRAKIICAAFLGVRVLF
jgi:hypothetical protein